MYYGKSNKKDQQRTFYVTPQHSQNPSNATTSTCQHTENDPSITTEIEKEFEAPSIKLTRVNFKDAILDIGIKLDQDKAYYHIAERYASVDNGDLAYFKNYYKKQKDRDTKIKDKNKILQHRRT